MRFAWVLALLVLASCEGSGHEQARKAVSGARLGVQSAAPEDRRAGWLRVTPQGVSTLAARVRKGFGPRNVEVPRVAQGELVVCEGGCSLQVDPHSFDLSVGPAASLQVTAAFRARAASIPVTYGRSWLCAFQERPACVVGFDTHRGTTPTLDVALRAKLQSEHPAGRAQARAVGGRLTLLAEAPRLTRGLESADLTIAAGNTCGKAYCPAASLPPLKALLAERVNAALARELETLAEPLLCQPCSLGCGPGARCEAGICQGTNGRCAGYPLGASFALRSDDGPRWELFAALADEATSSAGGLEAALRITSRFDRRHPCVPPRAAPPSAPLPPGLFRGGADRGSDVRLLLGEAALSRAGWGAHQAGLFCREGDSSGLPSWTTRLLLLSLGHREPLEGNLEVSFRPIEPPTLRLLADGRLAIELSHVELTLEGRFASGPRSLGSAKLRVRGELALRAHERALVALVDRKTFAFEVLEVRPPPNTAATAAGPLRTVFGLLAEGAIASLPELVELADALPPGLELHAGPSTREGPARRSGKRVRAIELGLRWTR